MLAAHICTAPTHTHTHTVIYTDVLGVSVSIDDLERRYVANIGMLKCVTQIAYKMLDGKYLKKKYQLKHT